MTSIIALMAGGKTRKATTNIAIPKGRDSFSGLFSPPNITP